MMYLTEEQKRKLSYAGKRLDDEISSVRERRI